MNSNAPLVSASVARLEINIPLYHVDIATDGALLKAVKVGLPSVMLWFSSGPRAGLMRVATIGPDQVEAEARSGGPGGHRGIPAA
jgi:hypothetical protein